LKETRNQSNYRLELPDDLKKRRINDTFHVNLLKPYIASSDERFPNRHTADAYDLGAPPGAEFTVADIMSHRWTKKSGLELLVLWELGDSTWEPLESCSDLAALDAYLKLKKCSRPEDLPKAPLRRRRRRRD
jgi:hypothetical protein